MTTKSLLLSTTLFTLVGCSTFDTPVPPAELRVSVPSELPTSTLTTMTPALSCLDDMMVAYKKAPVYLASADISNFTKEHSLSSGMNEMLISALSKMSVRSSGVRYISYDPSVQNILTLQGAHPQKEEFRAPDYFLRGGVTQVNKDLWQGQNGIGASAEVDPGQLLDGGSFFILQGQDDLTKSLSNSSNYVSLSMDMNVGHLANLQIIPGVGSSNTLGMQMTESEAISGDLSVHDIGVSYSLSESVTKDINTMLRMLVEVASIEVIGKLQAIPYHRCLLNAADNTKTYKELLPVFISKISQSPEELIKTVQTALADLEYYDGKVNGQLDSKTSEALARYQSRMGLLSSGIIGFDTFRMINTVTPTRDTPYSTWWLNERGIVGEQTGAVLAQSPVATSENNKEDKQSTTDKSN